MAAAVKYLYSFLYDKTASNTVSLFGAVLFGSLLYFTTLLFLKIEEIEIIRKKAMNVVKNIKLL